MPELFRSAHDVFILMDDIHLRPQAKGEKTVCRSRARMTFQSLLNLAS